MADDTLERIEKQLEGNSLALSAVAEVLQKMDGKLSREEEQVLAKQQEEQDADDRTGLIKDIALEVAGILKGQDTDQGMDVDGEKTRPAAKAGAAKGGDSAAEKPVNPTTKIEEQQATIQAMLKAFSKGEAEEYPDEEAVPEEKSQKKGMKYKAEDAVDDDDPDLDKEATDEDEEEDLDKDGEAEEEEEKDPAKAMAKQLDKMQKQLASYEANMQKSIQVEAEGRLRKMGWREENSLQSPQMIPLGVDGTMPLKKAQNAEEVADQLTQLSYKQLRDMQFAIEHGNTDGIPKELIGR